MFSIEVADGILTVSFDAQGFERSKANEGPLRHHLALLRRVIHETNVRARVAGDGRPDIGRCGDWTFHTRVAPVDAEPLQAAMQLLLANGTTRMIELWLHRPPQLMHVGARGWQVGQSEPNTIVPPRPDAPRHATTPVTGPPAAPPRTA